MSATRRPTRRKSAMAIPWPEEVIWPVGLHEHATRLSGYVQNVLLHFQRETHAVPADQVIKVMMATISLITKVQRTPDMSTVHDKIRGIHTEVTQNANGVAKELAAMRDELKSLTNNVQTGALASQEASAAAKEAAEVGKTVAGMTRDIKNKGIQHQAGMPMSYAAAAAAAHGAVVASTYSTQNVRTATAPVQREIIVNIRNPHTIQTLRAMNPRAMKAHVDAAIVQSENEHIAKITTMSTNQLKSGDLSIRTATIGEMQTLRQFTDDWVPRLGSGTSVRTPTYGVLVHGIRTSTIDMEKFGQVRNEILQANKPFIPTADIRYIGWLTGKTPPVKAMSSIIIEFTKAEDANKIIDEGLVWQGEMCQSERYERQCRLKQCFQCHKYGHIGTQCKAARTCGYCALEHRTSECPTRTERDATRKCAVCHGPHEAWSHTCPTRKEELAKTKAAYTNRPRYHPTQLTNSEIHQRGLTREPLRRSRSTRDLAQQGQGGDARTESPAGRGQKRAAPEGEKENETPLPSQRPQRAIMLSRRALEALETNALGRSGSTQMDIDTNQNL